VAPTEQGAAWQRVLPLIDAATPNCFNTRKARLLKCLWFEREGSFVRGGKYYFSVAKYDVIEGQSQIVKFPA
jgi:hypothetical protein